MSYNRFMCLLAPLWLHDSRLNDSTLFIDNRKSLTVDFKLAVSFCMGFEDDFIVGYHHWKLTRFDKFDLEFIDILLH